MRISDWSSDVCSSDLFIGDYAHLLPIAIFMKMVDLPMADVPRLKYWADELNLPTGAMTMTQIMAAFAGYLTPYIAVRRQAPGGDLISALVKGAVDGETLSTDDATTRRSQCCRGGLDAVASSPVYVAGQGGGEG